jgi:hypothetical protein
MAISGRGAPELAPADVGKILAGTDLANLANLANLSVHAASGYANRRDCGGATSTWSDGR